MDNFVRALGPAFAAGFAVQQLLEILDPLISRLFGPEADKKAIQGLISFLVGLVLAFGAGLRVLEPLGIHEAGLIDAFVTALIISAGTEGINSVLKFLGYSKEKQKGEAALAQEKASPPALSMVERR